MMYAISPKSSKLPANGHLQVLHSFQDPTNGALVTCLQQLWDLRRVGFSIVRLRDGGKSFERFITDLQEFVQERSLRLECIHIQEYGDTAGENVQDWSRKYKREVNARNELVGWDVEYGVNHMPHFVDRW
jgi:hypothetical protein